MGCMPHRTSVIYAPFAAYLSVMQTFGREPVIAIVLFATAAVCAPPAAANVVGFYEGQSTSKGRIGSVIELKADGTALVGSTVILNSPYRVASGHLFVSGNDMGVLSFTGE